MSRRMLPLLLLVLGLAAPGCGGGSDNNVLSPTYQPEVTNNPDEFMFQATGVQMVTQSLVYTWQNTGTESNLNLSSAISGGSATLTLLDASGTQVYTGSLSDNGTFQSSVGTSGNWTIRVQLTAVTGTLNFRVQKKT